MRIKLQRLLTRHTQAAPGSGLRQSVALAAAIVFTVGLVLLGTGCRLIRGVTDAPAQAVRAITPASKDKNTADPVEVQQNLLRFAAEFSAQMVGGIDKLRLGTNAIDPAVALNWKILLVSETCSIVSGPNPLANLLDMTVVVTSVRLGIEEYWQPKVFGASAQPMLEMCRSMETNIWALAGRVLKPEQQEELRQALVAWRQLHPVALNILGVRAVGFATEVALSKKANMTAPGSVFGLLGLDPLSGLDPATREISHTRMFAERALYVSQWMPTLLRWQMELLSLKAMAMPEVQQVVSNSTHLAASVERFARAAEQLPKQVSAEREQITKALEAQEKQLTPLVNEVRQTLTAGSQMAASLNTTITTFDALMKRFGIGETNSASGPPDTNSAPFRILDYAQTAAQLEKMAKQLTELLRVVDETTGSNNLSRISTQLTPVVQQAQAGGKEVVDYAFWKGILLVVVMLAAALLYRFLSPRVNPVARNGKASL